MDGCNICRYCTIRWPLAGDERSQNATVTPLIAGKEIGGSGDDEEKGAIRWQYTRNIEETLYTYYYGDLSSGWRIGGSSDEADGYNKNIVYITHRRSASISRSINNER